MAISGAKKKQVEAILDKVIGSGKYTISGYPEGRFVTFYTDKRVPKKSINEIRRMGIGIKDQFVESFGNGNFIMGTI